MQKTDNTWKKRKQTKKSQKEKLTCRPCSRRTGSLPPSRHRACLQTTVGHNVEDGANYENGENIINAHNVTAENVVGSFLSTFYMIKFWLGERERIELQNPEKI